jgi:hypothetical protein
VLRAPEAHLYVAVLTNAAPPKTPPQDLAVKLAARVLQVSMDAPEVPVTEQRLDEYAGVYRLADSRNVTVSREGQRLYAQEDKAERVELVPIGNDLFEERAHQTRYGFRREHRRIATLEIEPRILMAQRAERVRAER